MKTRSPASATALVGLQFGDEGKGKLVDWFAEQFGLIIRYNGGANAGHTVQNALGTFKLHLVPSGIFTNGAQCFLGNGAVVDPEQLVLELGALREAGIDTRGFFLSSKAHLVMPWHKVEDVLFDKARGKDAIGTTGRGIGPCYVDKVNRCGIRVGTLLDQRMLRERVHVAYTTKVHALRRQFPTVDFTIPKEDAIIAQLQKSTETLGEYIANTDVLARIAWKNGTRILLEAAQATMIDLEFGTYPYVTSSLATSAGACSGSGLPPTAIESVVGVAKAYTTRVGNGPFPTELFDESGETLRAAGQEFGTTTGRPRRCGWFDAPLVRYACNVNGADKVFLTKLDVLSALPSLRICVAYDFRGEIRIAPPGPQEPYEEFTPVYEDLPGWHTPIAGVTSWDALPDAAKRYVDRIEEMIGVPVATVATGPAREHIIVR